MKFIISDIDKNKTGVYCITNLLNDKIYIGSTSVSFRHRYLQYKSAFNRELSNQPILFRAFKKYGFDNFSFSLVCICSKKDCIKMEQFYIDKGVDYNSCLIAGSMLGFKHPKDSKTRTVIKGNHHCAIEVDRYTKEGVFLNSYASVTEACEENDIKSKSNIIQCCKGKVYSAGGFRWAYKGSTLPERVDKRTLPISDEKRSKMSKPRNKKFHSKKIHCNCLTTGKVYSFNSVKDASLFFNILKTSIHNNLSGLSKTVTSNINKNKLKFSWH